MLDQTRNNGSGRTPLVELRHLTKVYQEAERTHTVLCDVEVTIERGEFVVLLGRSGSGKSTLLNVISGIDLPTGGEVIIHTSPQPLSLTQLGEQERTRFRRRNLGFIFQFFNLIPTLSVEENLLLPLELNGRFGKEECRSALALLACVGLAVRAQWQSPRDGARYPSRWHVRIPAEQMELEVIPYLADQELDTAIRYWEGAVRLRGSANGRPLSGQGYVELTGYSDTRDQPASVFVRSSALSG